VHARPAKRPVVKRPVVKHAVVKHAVVKHAVVKVRSPAPKPQPYVPKAHVAPKGVAAVASTKGSSRNLATLKWLLLEVGGGLALILLFQWRRGLPAFSRSRAQRPRREPDTDALAAVAAVTQPQPKVARPRREAAADAVATVAVTQPLAKVARPRRAAEAADVATVAVTQPEPKVARPRRNAEPDTNGPVPVTQAPPEVARLRPKVEADADAPITQPVRHVVAVSRVARPHRKAEAGTDDPVPTRQPRRLVRLPRMHGPPVENEAETDAEAGLYARSYLEWLEKH
jgi:hypothetical protein